MQDASLRSQPSAEAGAWRGFRAPVPRPGGCGRSLPAQEPAWMEVGATRENSTTKRRVFIYIL